MEKRRVIEGRFYRHFKGKIYQVKCVARDCETQEEKVVYQAMYPPFGTWIRSMEEFLSPIPEKYAGSDEFPYMNQIYRFVEVKFDKAAGASKEHTQAAGASKEQAKAADESIATVNTGAAQPASVSSPDPSKVVGQPAVQVEKASASAGAGQDEASSTEERWTMSEKENKILMDFLDADSFKSKKEIIRKNRKEITPSMVQSMAIGLDLHLDSKNLDENINYILKYLNVNDKYMGSRLR
ncbi:MAG: DUF1653 domain-containing protein [Lachnospiraceae bacterium]|nr:DUF1653 domain-containing protein [Lachnospiraceae bacterium]